MRVGLDSSSRGLRRLSRGSSSERTRIDRGECRRMHALTLQCGSTQCGHRGSQERFGRSHPLTREALGREAAADAAVGAPDGAGGHADPRRGGGSGGDARRARRRARGDAGARGGPDPRRSAGVGGGERGTRGGDAGTRRAASDGADQSVADAGARQAAVGRAAAALAGVSRTPRSRHGRIPWPSRGGIPAVHSPRVVGLAHSHSVRRAWPTRCRGSPLRRNRVVFIGDSARARAQFARLSHDAADNPC
jgi:hypothetical protein